MPISSRCPVTDVYVAGAIHFKKRGGQSLAHASNPSPWEAEDSEFQFSLGHITRCGGEESLKLRVSGAVPCVPPVLLLHPAAVVSLRPEYLKGAMLFCSIQGTA